MDPQKVPQKEGLCIVSMKYSLHKINSLKTSSGFFFLRTRGGRVKKRCYEE